MKTAFNTNQTDNVATATLLAATFVVIMGSAVTSNDAHAASATQRVQAQKMDTIVVSAPRFQQIARMDTIVVTASRRAVESSRFLVASK